MRGGGNIDNDLKRDELQRLYRIKVTYVGDRRIRGRTGHTIGTTI